MMRRVTGELLSVAVGATIAGYCFSGPAEIQPGPEDVSREANPELQEAFREVDNYWEHTRGLGELGIKLIFVEKGEKFICTTQSTRLPIESDFDSSGIYCDGDKTTAIAADTWKNERKQYMTTGGASLDYSRLLLGHEYGHSLQQLNDNHLKLKETDFSPTVNAAIEQQADCLDGIFIKDTDAAVTHIDNWFNMIGDASSDMSAEDAHGTAQERKQAYLSGQSPVDDSVPNCGLTTLPHKSQ